MSDGVVFHRGRMDGVPSLDVESCLQTPGKANIFFGNRPYERKRVKNSIYQIKPDLDPVDSGVPIKNLLQHLGISRCRYFILKNPINQHL